MFNKFFYFHLLKIFKHWYLIFLEYFSIIIPVKKNIVLLFLPILVLTSCKIQHVQRAQFGIDSSLLKENYKIYNELNGEETDDQISLFGTSITAALYLQKKVNLSYVDLTDEEVSKIKESFNNTFTDYHVIFDRHYYYVNRQTDALINNVKVLNDSIGSGKFIKVDPLLYKALKDGYNFTINSENKFSIFIGNLADVYDEYIDLAKYRNYPESPYYILSEVNDRYFYSAPAENKVNDALVCTPSLDELKNETLIEFDDSTSSVKINNTKRCQSANGKLNISLSGQGKGLAVEKFVDDNNEYSMLINGGSSSIKTNRQKYFDDPWDIALTNPINRELIINSQYLDGEYVNFTNSYELMLEFPDSFNLSTSGYYENYYYVPLLEDNTEWTLSPNSDDPNSSIYNQNNYYNIKNLYRVNHIINPTTGKCEQFFDFVSVLLNDSELADMYTTCLMNTSSVEEAENMRTKLDKIYNQKSQVIYSYKNDNSMDSFFIYPFTSLENEMLLNGITNLQTSFANTFSFKQIYKLSSYFEDSYSTFSNKGIKQLIQVEILWKNISNLFV